MRRSGAWTSGIAVALACGCGTSGSAPSSSSSGPQLALVVAHDKLTYDGFACAAKIGGQVACWGSGLVIGAITGQSCESGCSAGPTIVPGVDDVLELSAGYSSACARSADGLVRCWGWNANGETDPAQQNFEIEPIPPTVVAGVDHAVGITGGDLMTCALISDGTVRCWGYQMPKPTPVAGIAGAVALSRGTDDQACALLAGGTVACWGPAGQAATPVSGISGAIALVASQGHASALLRDGRVLCWGDCGSANVTTPTVVPNMTGTVDLGNGADFDNCVRTYDGHVRCACMGLRAFQLAEGAEGGTASCDFAFHEVPGVDRVLAVAEAGDVDGKGTACAARADGSVWCWQGHTGPIYGPGESADASLPGPEPVTLPF